MRYLAQNPSASGALWQRVDCMVDSETLSTGPDSVVLSFAAVKFVHSIVSEDGSFYEIGNDNIISTFYAVLDIESQLGIREISESTLLWWMDQGEEARQKAFTRERLDITDRLVQFNDWVTGHEINCFWANSPSFDMIILDSLAKDFQCKTPWGYRNVRDQRTLVDAARLPPDWTPPNFKGVAHDPLSDCLWQIEVVRECTRRLNRKD